VTVVLSLLPIKAAYMSVMHYSNQITMQLPYIPDQKSLTLCYCSFSEFGSDCVRFSFAYKGCQYFDYGSMLLHSPWIMQDTRPNIIAAPLMLILDGSGSITNTIANIGC